MAEASGKIDQRRLAVGIHKIQIRLDESAAAGLDQPFDVLLDSRTRRDEVPLRVARPGANGWLDHQFAGFMQR